MRAQPLSMPKANARVTGIGESHIKYGRSLRSLSSLAVCTALVCTLSHGGSLAGPGQARPAHQLAARPVPLAAPLRLAVAARARNPRWEPGMGMIPDPRQIGDGDGDGPPIPGKSGIGDGDDPRL